MKKTFIALVALAALTALGLSVAAQQGKSRDLFYEYQQSASNPPPRRKGKPGSRVKLELMRENKLSLVSPKAVLMDGDRIAFRMAVNYEGYMTVTNIGTSGKVNLLYAGRVSPTTDMRIPEKGWIVVKGKSGDEVVNFIMSEGPAQELQQLNVQITEPAQAPPPGAYSNLASNAEAQEILALLNSRALKRSRDLVVEADNEATYALAATPQTLSTPTGFSITLIHK